MEEIWQYSLFVSLHGFILVLYEIFLSWFCIYSIGSAHSGMKTLLLFQYLFWYIYTENNKKKTRNKISFLLPWLYHWLQKIFSLVSELPKSQGQILHSQNRISSQSHICHIPDHWNPNSKVISNFLLHVYK